LKHNVRSFVSTARAHLMQSKQNKIADYWPSEPRRRATVSRAIGCLFILVVCPSGWSAEILDHDEEFLQEAKLKTDGESLLAFLREQFPERADPSQTDKLIQQLGVGEFAQREEASRLLTAIGPSALPALRQALKNPDSEVASRAKGCIQAINQPSGQVLAPAVARLLVKKRPPGSVETVLRYLPYAVDQDTIDEVCFGLEAIVVKQEQLDPSLLAALRDPFPIRRAIAACLVGSRGNPEQRAQIRKLWTDPDRGVRLRAAQGLLAAREKEAIPILIGQLEGVSTDIAWQAEELLHWVAGDETPEPTIGTGSPNESKACRAAWEAWWQANREQLKLNNRDPKRRNPGLCLAVIGRLVQQRTGNVKWEKNGGAVWLCGCNGKVRWQLENLSRVDDAHLLPGNRVLLAQRREHTQGEISEWAPVIGVTERDLDGKILWQYKGFEIPCCCQRLPNGNTLICDGGPHMVEINAMGEQVFKSKFGRTTDIEWMMQPLRNRRFFARKYLDQRMNDELVEFDASIDRGRVLNKVPLPVFQKGGGFKAEPMSNGHYLIMAGGSDHIFEIDRTGTVVWHANLRGWHATPLCDGNVLVVFQKKNGDPTQEKWLVEITPDHQVFGEVLVKEKTARDRPVGEGVGLVRPCLNLVRLGFASKSR
jgi:hypothetical protein